MSPISSVISIVISKVDSSKAIIIFVIVSVYSSFGSKNYTRVEVTGNDKHSNLTRCEGSKKV